MRGRYYHEFIHRFVGDPLNCFSKLVYPLGVSAENAVIAVLSERAYKP
jgi:hypothetical protein